MYQVEGTEQAHNTKKYPGSMGDTHDENARLKFTFDNLRAIRERYPFLISDGLFRVDIMLKSTTDTLVLNEFESFEAGHLATKSDLNSKVSVHLHEFWDRVVCAIASSFSI